MNKNLITLFALVIAWQLSLSRGMAETITLMTHDSFNVSKERIQTFEQQNQVTLRVFKAGDAGAALVQAILSKENPLADVFFGIDNTFLSRAIRADIFTAYSSPHLKNIPKALQLDSQHRLLPVDFGDVCLNYDNAWFATQGIQPPTDLTDLIKPQYKNLTVVENPASSSPGLAFLLATIGRFGEKGYLNFWKQLKKNGVMVTSGWEDAYFGHFSAASKGNRPIVVSYGSSPAAAVYYAEQPMEKAPTTAVLGNRSAFRQIEFVGILKGTKKRALAEKLVDFLLSQPFQEDIPLQMFVYPANTTATLPTVFTQFARMAEQPASVSPEAIEGNRDAWIEAWTNTVLR